jgi:acetoacetyl-CoA synthetase
MAKMLWKPSGESVRQTNMYRFMNFINDRHGQKFSEFEPLYQWSIENIADFWAAFWEFADIKASKPYDQVIDDVNKMPGSRWFSGARLNFAENLLRYRDDRIALIFKGEAQGAIYMTYAELYDEVARLAKSLKETGVVPGDRVVGFMPNMPQSIMAMLAATSLGATWSSCSPDFGIKGVLDRFGQIQPKVLFTANGYSFKGKAIDSLSRISDILKKLPSTQKVIVVPYTEQNADISSVPNGVHYNDFISSETGLEIEFEQLPADHPLYIMYSSGTTGLPKCMVQSAGGILIHQKKELMLHTDLKRQDTIFYFTTCGWMPWCCLTATRFIPIRERCGKWPRMKRSRYLAPVQATLPLCKTPGSNPAKTMISARCGQCCLPDHPFQWKVSSLFTKKLSPIFNWPLLPVVRI